MPFKRWNAPPRTAAARKPEAITGPDTAVADEAPGTRVAATRPAAAPMFATLGAPTVVLQTGQPGRTMAPNQVSVAHPVQQPQLGNRTLPVTAVRPAPPSFHTSSNREFLPAALEILATPPSPASSAMLLCICGAVLTALAWSYYGHIDIHAVAAGKIQPSGRSKIVQPLETGKVVAIQVENGASVTAGDVLLELDPTETGADRQSIATELEAASAEVARRAIAIQIAAEANGDLLPQAVPYPSGVSAAVRRREDDLLASDLGQLRSSIASLDAQLAEKKATKRRLERSVEARGRLIKLAQERVDMRKTAEANGAGSRALIIEALQQLEGYVTTDVGERGQLDETDAGVTSLVRKVEEARTKFTGEQTQKLADIDQKRVKLVQDLVKAQSRRDRMQLRAPIDGQVQQLSVSTIGQVVSPGQSLLTVVPVNGPIEVEAMIANKDIGFVEVGQSAVVKVDAFPFTRYGTIDATVVRVSKDAVDEQTYAGQESGDPSKAQGGAAAARGATSNLVFPATLKLAQRTIHVDAKEIALIAGMSVSVEVRTGERRVIDFLLSPITEITQQTGHER